MPQLADLLQPGQRIFVAGSVNEPTGLLDDLRTRALPERLHFIQFPLAGYNRQDFTAYEPTAEQTTFFMTPHLKDADPARLHFLPMQMRRVYDVERRGHCCRLPGTLQGVCGWVPTWISPLRYWNRRRGSLPSSTRP